MEGMDQRHREATGGWRTRDAPGGTGPALASDRSLLTCSAVLTQGLLVRQLVETHFVCVHNL